MNIYMHRIESIKAEATRPVPNSENFARTVVFLDDKGHRLEVVLFADDRKKLDPKLS